MDRPPPESHPMNDHLVWQPTLEMPDTPAYSVVEINQRDTHYFLLNIHYAKRVPSISYSYGLINQGQLVGVVTYGKPASPSLCVGICGKAFSENVYELNRLCLLDNKRNEASRLVGGSLKMLPSPTIVVSYADTKEQHTGFVYQATNFIYTGLSARHSEWTLRGNDNIHSRSLFHEADNRPEGQTALEFLQNKYGDTLQQKERSRKHRYVYFVGNKTQKRAMRNNLKYEILPYPKPETTQQ